VCGVSVGQFPLAKSERRTCAFVATVKIFQRLGYDLCLTATCQEGAMKRQFYVFLLFAVSLSILIGVSIRGGLSQAGTVDEIGVVLMHGKDSTSRPKSPVGKLAGFLKKDFMVLTPVMSWSKNGGFDRTLEETYEQIDMAVKALRKGGATKIVVGGHSMGAAAALAYATQASGLAGVLMIAPGHRPDTYADLNTDALAKAKTLIAAGNPNDEVNVSDKNQGKRISRTLQADVAVSWFDPTGLAVMQNAALKVPPRTPVLFIIGEDDRLHPRGKTLIFDNLPAHSKSAYVVVHGGHKKTPIKGRAEITTWLQGF
jgi:pimeloyl-ACP methyl ester carboxylesterase